MTESQIQEQATSQVQTATTGQYNFTLNVTGQLALQAQESENETTQEAIDETIQTQ
jgi:hypothetical protein